MKSDLVHPFIDCLAKVLEESTGTAVRRGAVAVSCSPLSTLGVASIIGITGAAEGRMVLDMTPETACRVAGKLNDETIGAFDSLAASTINELANMICGRAVSLLVNRGIALEINPPTLFSGREMDVINADMETVMVPVDTDYGLINMNIAIRLK
jgi:chemotaxis protein CheX